MLRDCGLMGVTEDQHTHHARGALSQETHHTTSKDSQSRARKTVDFDGVAMRYWLSNECEHMFTMYSDVVDVLVDSVEEGGDIKAQAMYPAALAPGSQGKLGLVRHFV